MDLHDDTIDELSGDGTIIIGQAKLGAIYYWLTIVPVAGRPSSQTAPSLGPRSS